MKITTAKFFLTSLLCQCLASVGFGHDGYPRQPQFDVLHYALTLQLCDTSNVIRGEATLRIGIRSDLATRNLRLDLKEMSVTGLTLNAHSTAFQQKDDAVLIALPARFGAGDTLEVTVVYHGEPKDGLIIANNKFGRRCFFADNWPDRARYWFPSIDHPSDKSTVFFQVTLPAHYTVVANGRLLNVRETAFHNKSWSWLEQVPIPTYCMVFGAADFAVLTDDTVSTAPVSYYVYPDDAAFARQNFGRVREMMQFFSARFGTYPYAKLALVQSSTRYGGMENASAIFFAESSLGADRNIESTTAHEIAHQWFGDSVTETDWHHLWLSEGFATYGAALFFEYVDGAPALHEKMRANRDNYFNYATAARGPILDSTITEYMALLSPNNYAKAGWVLHMLRGVVGDEAFWRGLRSYHARHQYGNALTDDFRLALEEASGTSLEWFFRQWLEQSDYPVVRAQWRWQAAQRQVVMHVQQTQERSFYRCPVEVVLHTAQGDTRRQFWMNERTQQMTWQIEAEPERIVFDPEVKLLMRVEVVKAD